MEVNKLLTPYNHNAGTIERIKYIVIHYVGATGGAKANCEALIPDAHLYANAVCICTNAILAYFKYACFNIMNLEGFSMMMLFVVPTSAERSQRLCLWNPPPLKRRAKLLVLRGS